MKQTKTYCNKCGKEFDKTDMTGGIMSFRHYIGYGSVHDGSCIVLDLCADCLDNLIDSCKISPLEDAEYVNRISSAEFTTTVARSTSEAYSLTPTDPYQITLEA